jgi:1,4-dihydroxy-2-naphthoyl-CoA hydrolase
MSLAASLQERFEGLLPDLLGIEFTEVAPERVVATLSVRPALCTIGGVLHGGAIMAFADTLGAVGTVVNLPPGTRTTTIESKTNFLGAAPAGGSVVGESTPVHRGRTTMVWQTRVSLASGKLVALVTQTQMVLPAA